MDLGRDLAQWESIYHIQGKGLGAIPSTGGKMYLRHGHVPGASLSTQESPHLTPSCRRAVALITLKPTGAGVLPSRTACDRALWDGVSQGWGSGRRRGACGKRESLSLSTPLRSSAS